MLSAGIESGVNAGITPPHQTFLSFDFSYLSLLTRHIMTHFGKVADAIAKDVILLFRFESIHSLMPLYRSPPGPLRNATLTNHHHRFSPPKNDEVRHVSLCGLGKSVRYALGGGWADALSDDGHIWLSVASSTPF